MISALLSFEASFKLNCFSVLVKVEQLKWMITKIMGIKNLEFNVNGLNFVMDLGERTTSRDKEEIQEPMSFEYIDD